MPIDLGEQLMRRQSAEVAIRPESPLHRALPVDQDRRGSDRIAPMGIRPRVNATRCGGESALRVGHHDEVRKVRLRLLGFLKAFDGSHYDTRVPPGKLRMRPFELTELGHAEQSPPT